MNLRLFIFTLLFSFSSFCYAQNPVLKKDSIKPFITLKKVKEPKKKYYRNPKNRNPIFEADSIKGYREHPDKIFLTKKVKMVYQGATLTCDSAVWNEKTKFFEAFGEKVHLKQDTVDLYAKHIEYNGEIQYAKAFDQVVLKDRKMKLETNQLDYDRANQLAFYNNWGTIYDGENTITSKIGKYNMAQKQYIFKEKVNILNKDQVIDAENAVYFLDKKQVEFFGRSRIKDRNNPKNSIFTENGNYNTQTKQANLYLNNRINYEDKILIGDQLFYNQKTGFGWAKGSVSVDDPLEDRVIYSNYAEVYKFKDSTFATGDALAVKRFEKDTLFIHADTLMAYKKNQLSMVRAFHYAKFIKGEIRGKSDSIHFDEAKGHMNMNFDPILWTKHEQLTGDTIDFWLNPVVQKLDSARLTNHAFLISLVDTIDLKKEEYNQVKGKYLTAKFREDKLYETHVNTNAESIVYIDEEDADNPKKKERIGINKSLCRDLKMFFEDNEASKLFCLGNADSKTYPEKNIDSKDRILKDFNYRIKEKIRDIDDLYNRAEDYLKIKKKLKERAEKLKK